MNYKICTKTKNLFKKATKGLIVLCAFSLIISSNSYAQTLPTCAGMTTPAPIPGTNCLPNCDDVSVTTPEPGANCLYYDLPLCTTNDHATTSLTATPEPRVNCANLIDLPLCNDVSLVTPDPGKNCVTECVHLSGSGERGIDFAKHGRDCIRFEGTLSNGNTNTETFGANYNALANSLKFTAKQCHQSVSGYTTASSCDLLSCDLLTVDEVNHSKFQQDDSKQYCDGSTTKCHTLDQNKLQYFISRNNNTMCTTHICQPLPLIDSPHCTDETQDVINKGNDYVKDYQKYIFGIDPPADFDSSDNHANVRQNLALGCTSPAIANRCKPIHQRQYYCSDATPPVKNVNCDASSSCDAANICTKEIDCNIPSTTEPECSSPTPGNGSEPDVQPLDRREWFFYPKPMSKATNSAGELHSNMDHSELCYSAADLEANNWGKRVMVPNPIPYASDIDLGYYHSQGLPDKSRSPGKCNATFDGFRGTGYIYLCGNDNNVNAKASRHTAYHKSSSTVFTNTDTETTLDVCLRFKNSTMPKSSSGSETCGRRECAIACFWNICASQLCGFDVCRELVVKESESDKCVYNNNMFSHTNEYINGVETKCLGIVDKSIYTGMRVRAVQYGNRICTFLDSFGQLAHSNMFMEGDETLSDGTCLTDPSSTTDCNGKNANALKGSSSKWRALMRIPYIEHDSKIDTNSNFTGAKGYLDASGNLVKEQECMKIPLRARSPRLYNLATQTTSSRLFRPPLYILDSYIQKDGNISLPESISESLGPTDFNYPEINVKYGDTVEQKLSLTIGKTGSETDVNEIDPNASKTITTSFNSVPYTTKISIKKEYNATTKTPYLCLYETIQDVNGIDRTYKLECVKRRLPEIDGSIETLSSTRKVLITDPSPANTYDNFDISIKYQGNHATDLAGSSDEIILRNDVQHVPQCNSQTENYKLCVQREECSKITNECVQNEISIQNAAPGDDLTAFHALRYECENSLKIACEKKEGIVGSTQYNNAYGWFNEICVSSGFETKLQNVIAHKVDDPSIMGKCVIDTSASTGTCADGGKPAESGSAMDNCICVQSNNLGALDPALYYVRKQTNREAGLCIDIPIPQQCSGTLYDHASDSARTAATAVGNADFTSFAFGGMNNVTGLCKENWTYQKDPSSGARLYPTMNCVTASGVTDWDTSSIQNHCVRYECDPIYSEPRLDGDIANYTNSYTDPSETKDYDPTATTQNKGYSHGYALWSRTISGDSNVTATAQACIPGFEASSSGLPTRECDSRGNWDSSISNKCVRKTCSRENFVSNAIPGDAVQDWSTDAPWMAAWNASAINPDNHAVNSVNWTAAWENWSRFGGAMFNETPASRAIMAVDTDDAPAKSIAEGVCNESLGFFQGGNYPPTVKCDTNGNWALNDVQNPCVTECVAVLTNSESLVNSNHGNALWNQGIVSFGQSEADGTFAGCAIENEGLANEIRYKQYPYSPPTDKYGVSTQGVHYSIDPDDSSQKVDDLGGALSNPRRVCNSVYTGSTFSTYWSTAYPACIKKCPGADTDDRIGVGVTKHQLSDLSYVYIRWPDLDPGTSHVIYSQTPSLQNVSNYGDVNTTNDIFAIKRECDAATYTWKTYTVGSNTEYVVPQCSSRNSGADNSTADIVNSYARFGIGPSNSTLDEGRVITARNCIDTYGNAASEMPQYECVAKDSNRYIDQFYYREKSGSPTCIKTCQANQNQNYGAGSKYTSTSGQYFPGDPALDLVCQSGYGHKLGTPTCSGNTCNSNVKQCGRRVNSTDNSRIAQNPTMTCQADGSWSVLNDCQECEQCTCSSSSCGTTTGTTNRAPFIASTETSYQRVAYCTYANDGGSDDDDVFTSGPYNKDQVTCGNGDDQTFAVYPSTSPVNSGSSSTSPTTTGSDSNSVIWTFTCHDGLFVVTETSREGNGPMDSFRAENQ